MGSGLHTSAKLYETSDSRISLQSQPNNSNEELPMRLPQTTQLKGSSELDFVSHTEDQKLPECAGECFQIWSCSVLAG